MRNIKKYEEEIEKLRMELGSDQIEFEFDDFRSYQPITYDKYLEIDLEFDEFDNEADVAKE